MSSHQITNLDHFESPAESSTTSLIFS
ncbi:uncharacterized protein METZ01_LOCUS348238, partial [marine metagenome]